MGETACGHAFLFKAESRVPLLFFLNWREQTSPDTQGWQWLFTRCWEGLGHAALGTNHSIHEQLLQAAAVRDSVTCLKRATSSAWPAQGGKCWDGSDWECSETGTVSRYKGWQDCVHCAKCLTVIHKFTKQSQPNREELQWNWEFPA